ncbi:IucA/IucC family protein [Saccharomonospora sp. NPDC006951]
MADLVDSLIQERLFGFGDAERTGDWLRVGDIRVRVRSCEGLQPYRYAGGPVLHGEKHLSPWELLRTIGDGEPFLDQVADDLRTAVAHSEVLHGAHVEEPLDSPQGERLAALRNRPFHPTAKAVVGWTAAELAEYGPMRRSPLGLDWIGVRTELLRFGGGGGDLVSALLTGSDIDAVRTRPGFHALPVHPWQYEHVLPTEFATEIADGAIVPIARGVGTFLPTASIRTLAAASPGVHVKLPLGVATLGAARLLPPRYLDNGERAERTMLAVLDRDPVLRDRVLVCEERTWCGIAEPEFGDRPGRLAAQVRRYPSGAENSVPMAAFASEHATLEADPLDFFRELARGFCEIGLGFLRYGVLPELHGQNVAVTLKNGLVDRFVLRDHDTLRVCPQWMQSAGLPEPGYRVRKGARQSLLLDTPGELLGYLQTLGFQVNLYGIADALSRTYGITERTLWHTLRTALTDCLERMELPPEVAWRLLSSPTWPSRQVLGPLLRKGRSGGVSMPSASGTVPNPLL